MPILMHGTVRLVEELEPLGRQRQQRPPLRLEELLDLCLVVP